MKILYIGETDTHNQYTWGIVPSHWLYGAVEMEREGHDVIWEQERRSFLNDIKNLCKYRPDVVFIPNINLHCHILLLMLSSLGIVRVLIYGFLHHEPAYNNWVKYRLYKLLLRGMKHTFFLSRKTMTKTIEMNIISCGKCSVPGWGPDKEFYDKVEKSDKGYFVSTGKENRDFDILIESFKKSGESLKIMTANEHAGNNYTGLIEQCKDIQNIEVIITENSGNVYPKMLEVMANARAIVCPLMKDKLNYCVGLSSIMDAIGLNKPLIITRNPYHDEIYKDAIVQVDTLESWCEAISDVNDCTIKTNVSMKACYDNMKQYMSL